jgi:hypothetical protein
MTGDRRNLARGQESQPDIVCSLVLFSCPEGGEKTRLGGELRREERLIPRAGLSTDRGGTDDDLCEGDFSLAFPPSSGTTGVAQEPRSGRFASISSS